MIEFNWELPQILNSIKCGLTERQSTFFLRPHGAIWGDSNNFIGIAEEIMDLLPSESLRRQFLSACLGSYLLDVRVAPGSFPDWIESKIVVSELLGCDVSLEKLKAWRWGRAAFPALDKYENGKNDTIYYALVGKSTSDNHPLFPSWISDVLNLDGQGAVEISAKFASRMSPESHFFFWPFVPAQKPTHDKSLGLPIYLSFLSLVKNRQIPMVIATGEIDSYGGLTPVHGIYEKCKKAFAREYKKFIYPADGSYLERQGEKSPVAVNTLFEAEREWGVRSKTNAIDNENMAALKRHAQWICSAVLGQSNNPSVLISTFKSKEEELPLGMKATHEYMVIVDVSRLKYPIEMIQQSFSSFIGKEAIQYETKDSNFIYWGEGEQILL